MHNTHKSALALSCSAILLLTSCGNGEEGENGTEDLTVGYAGPVGSQPGQQLVMSGMEGGAEELGWETEFFDADLSPDQQVSDLQTMVNLGVDAIAVWALDPDAMRGPYTQAVDADISLIGVNSSAEEFEAEVVWAFNQCGDDAPLRQTAAMIAEERPGGEVIVMGGPPVPSIQLLVDCFTEAAEDEGLNIVNHTDNTNDDTSSATNLMSDLLLNHPDVDAVWAYNDASALGISSAVTQAGGEVSDGSNDGVLVYGMNADSDAIEAVRQGRITGTWDPDEPATGWAVVQAASDIAEGTTGQTYVVESTYWSAENIDEFVPKDEREYDLDSAPVTTE